MLVPVKEFVSAAEMRAFYARIGKGPLHNYSPLPPWPPSIVALMPSEHAPAPPEPEPVAVPPPQPVSPPKRPVVLIEDVKRAACASFHISQERLIGRERYEPLVHQRQIAVAVTYRLTRRSLPFVGRAFGGRDHTTILHSIIKMRPFIDEVAEGMPPDATPEQWIEVMRWTIDV